MALLKAVIGFVLVLLVVFGGWFVYENYFSGEVKGFGAISSGNSHLYEADLENISSDVKQFYANMRFNHNKISYFINPECDEAKSGKMKSAFSIIEDKTENLLAFNSAPENDADILVGCSADSYEKEENIFIAGEGGPTRIVNSSMPVITKGKILIYSEKGAECSQPLLELHELFHVFGYDHINDSAKIMYPYLNCGQEINKEMMDSIVKLYSIETFADLSISNITANQERYAGKWYLNFNLSLDNYGIIEAGRVALEIYSNGEFVHSFDFEEITFGGGENFYVKNLLLPGESENIEFRLTTTANEPNKINNNVRLSVD